MQKKQQIEMILLVWSEISWLTNWLSNQRDTDLPIPEEVADDDMI